MLSVVNWLCIFSPLKNSIFTENSNKTNSFITVLLIQVILHATAFVCLLNLIRLTQDNWIKIKQEKLDHLL